jgi:hypothetical protein
MSTTSNLSEADDECPSSLTSLTSPKAQLRKFKVNDDTYFRKNTLIIGKRGMGKTTFVIHEIYRQLCHRIDNVYVILPDGCARNVYDVVTNKTYKYQDLPTIVRHIKANRTQNTLIIIEHAGDSDIERLEAFKEVVLNGRCMNITMVMTVQYSMFSSGIRGNFDNIISARDNNQSWLKRLYEHYYGIFPSFPIFNAFVQILPEYTFLCVINTSHSTKIDDIIGWYKADITTDIIYRPSDLSIIEKNPLDTQPQSAILIHRINQVIDELVAIRNQLKVSSTDVGTEER